MDKNTSEIYASIEGVNVILPASLITWNSIIRIDLIENGVKVCSRKNVAYKQSKN